MTRVSWTSDRVWSGIALSDPGVGLVAARNGELGRLGWRHSPGLPALNSVVPPRPIATAAKGWAHEIPCLSGSGSYPEDASNEEGFGARARPIMPNPEPSWSRHNDWVVG